MNIEEAATQAGIDMSLWSMGAGSLAFVEGVHGIPRDEFERFAKIIRNQTLEDAAKCCDERAMKNERACDGLDEESVISLRSAAWQMSVCAAAIRAMKEQT